MSKYTYSQTIKNQIKTIIQEQGCSLEQFAQQLGISRENILELYNCDRLIPDSVTLETICRTYALDLARLIKYDPLTESLSQLLPSLVSSDREPMQITICGCGNLGHVFAGLLSIRQDLRVNVLVSTSEKAQKLKQKIASNSGITVKSDRQESVGFPNLVTAEPAEAIPGSHLVILCLPSFVEPTVLNRILPFLHEDTFIGSIPAPGGFNWMARYLLNQAQKKAVIFGIVAIPWMCKITEYGKEVQILGTKTLNGQVTIPSQRAIEVSDLMSNLLKMPVLDAKNFLQITLNPGNQLLHPGIMYSMFRNWDGIPLSEAPLFYENITEDGAEILQQMSDELIALKLGLEQQIPHLHLSAVAPLAISIQQGYGSAVRDRSTLRSTISTNLAYAGIRTPMNRVADGYIPNYQSRFFLEDVPYGLVVLKGIAELLGVATPALERVLIWSQSQMGREYLVKGKLQGSDVAESGAPQRFGLNSIEALAM